MVGGRVMALAKKLNERDKDAQEEERREKAADKAPSPPPQGSTGEDPELQEDTERDYKNPPKTSGENEDASGPMKSAELQQQHDGRKVQESSTRQQAVARSSAATSPRVFSSEGNGAVSYFTSAASPHPDLGRHVFYSSGSSHARLLPRSPPPSGEVSSSSSTQVSMTFEHVGSYQGALKQHQRQGTGTFKWEDGELFNGDWERDVFHGWGIYQWQLGQKYSGYWSNGRHEGQGYMSWSPSSLPGWHRGGRYSGSFMNGFRAGQGSETQTELGCYIGEWQQDMRAGEGLFKWVNGSKYLGEWSCDLRNGRGTFWWADGCWFEGEFHDEWPVSGTLVDTYEQCYHVEYRQSPVGPPPPALEMPCELAVKTHLGHISTQKKLM
eukprot:763798-Hanusia_phi.AAC.3